MPAAAARPIWLLQARLRAWRLNDWLSVEDRTVEKPEYHFVRFLVDGPVRCHCGWTPDDTNLSKTDWIRAVKEHADNESRARQVKPNRGC
jgi:hypothetical protein